MEPQSSSPVLEMDRLSRCLSLSRRRRLQATPSKSSSSAIVLSCCPNSIKPTRARMSSLVVTDRQSSLERKTASSTPASTSRSVQYKVDLRFNRLWLIRSFIPLKTQDVSAVASLSNSTGTALAVASPSLLRIGRIDAIQQIDIRTVPLEEDEPRRIAHDPKNRTFGVLCSRRDVDRSSGDRSTIASVRFLAEETFAST